MFFYEFNYKLVEMIFGGKKNVKKVLGELLFPLIVHKGGGSTNLFTRLS